MMTEIKVIFKTLARRSSTECKEYFPLIFANVSQMMKVFFDSVTELKFRALTKTKAVLVVGSDEC